MKLLAKVGLVAIVGGGVTALYAAPGAFSNSNESASLQQARARSRLVLDHIHEDAQHVQHLQSIARRQKDVIKLNCVNDKLVQIKPQMNVADNALASFDLDHRVMLTTMNQAGESIRRLREEADQCIGEPILGNESSNSYTNPGGYDPTSVNPWGNPIEPPAYASPYN